MMDQRTHSFGMHYLLEFSGCPAAGISRAADVKKVLLEAARRSGATILKVYFHQFRPAGVTGMIFIAESHFSIHTWPESGYAAVDILTCGVMEPQKAIDYLKEALQAGRVDVRRICRGFDDPVRGKG
jgi:S-adenosylmethionine decarboxylase